MSTSEEIYWSGRRRQPRIEDLLQSLRQGRFTQAHLFIRHMSDEEIRSRFEEDLEALQACDSNGDSFLHWMAQHKSPKIILRLAKILPQKCWQQQNDQKLTPLHYAAEIQSAKTLLELSPHTPAETWIIGDKDGTTPLHLIALRQKSVAILPHLADMIKKILHTVATRPQASAEQSPRIRPSDKGMQRKKSNLVMFACQQKDFQLLRLLADQGTLSGKFYQQCTDSEGNTPFHALFSSTPFGVSFNASEFLEAFKLLVDNGLDCSRENCYKQNCLHACTLAQDELRGILAEAERDLFEPMLTSSEGVHAVHTFAGRYELERDDDGEGGGAGEETERETEDEQVLTDQPEILILLARLSQQPPFQLLQVTVSGGRRRGATCLHFACKAGHRKNIKFLMSRGLHLSCTTEYKESCIDFAFHKNKINDVIAAAQQCNRQVPFILRLVDDVSRALKLQESSDAHRILSGYSDVPVREVQKSIEDQMAQTECTAELEMLLKSVEMDSPIIIRSLLSLNLLPPAAERQFPEFLKTKLQQIRGLSEAFPNSDDYINTVDLAKRYPSLISVCVHFNKFQIIPDLLLTRQFDLIPSCLDLLLQLQPKFNKRAVRREEQLMELEEKVLTILVNALEELYLNADSDQLFKYLNGEMTNEGDQTLCGPRFCVTGSKDKRYDLSVVEMMEDLDYDEPFATECMYRLAKKKWCVGSNKCARSCSKLSFSPLHRFQVNSIALVVFLAYLAWFITDFNRTFENPACVVILLSYALSYTVQEINDIMRGWERSKQNFRILFFRLSKRARRYLQDPVNYCDIVALVFLWTGTIWHIVIFSLGGASHPTSYYCQMCLASSFLLWGFRSVAVLNMFEHIGPLVSMLRELLTQDLLPFLSILFVIFYSFGVFFFNLLFPVVTATAEEANKSYNLWKVIQQVFTLPLFLTFGYFEKTEFENKTLNSTDEGGDQQIGKVAHNDGQKAFYNGLIFLFLLLVNLVMVNLLIARFSLTVSRMTGRVKVIWRKRKFELLREYQSAWIVPPPLSFPFYMYGFAREICRKCREVADSQSEKRKKRATSVSPATQHASESEVGTERQSHGWWTHESEFGKSEEFMKFLTYQAHRFRKARPLLTRSLTASRGDFEQLKASSENSLNSVQVELEEKMDRTFEKLSDLLDRKVQKLSVEMDERLQRRSSRRQRRRRDSVAQDQEFELEDRIDGWKGRDMQDQKMQELSEKMDEQNDRMQQLIEKVDEQDRKMQQLIVQMDERLHRRSSRRVRRSRESAAQDADGGTEGQD